MGTQTNKNAKRNKLIYKILFVIFLLIFLVSLGLMLLKNYEDLKSENKFDKLSNMTINTQLETVPESENETEAVDELTQLGIRVPEKNLDWQALMEENEHIYAWIYIPETNVDYPILQHPEELSYYLRTGLDGNYSTAGCINTEKLNSKDFTDPHTVIYGHNMRNQTMFATLHNYESLEFFENNPYIYIYMPDKVLVYEVFAAYERGDEHLLFSYNCKNKESFQSYIDSIYQIRDMGAHFREGTEVTADDYIVSLSTCVRGEDTSRYLVQGVLLNPSALNIEEVK